MMPWRLRKIVWASPCTALGLTLGIVGMVSGGGLRRRAGALECWGGSIAWVLKRLPLAHGVAAITFGHTILGQSEQALEYCRQHEMVHVRQYERWGLLFLPAYVLCSVLGDRKRRLSRQPL
jgi:hypothetical protein